MHLLKELKGFFTEKPPGSGMQWAGLAHGARGAPLGRLALHTAPSHLAAEEPQLPTSCFSGTSLSWSFIQHSSSATEPGAPVLLRELSWER